MSVVADATSVVTVLDRIADEIAEQRTVLIDIASGLDYLANQGMTQ